VALDLRQPQAREQLWSLVSGADVLLQNLKPGALARMGFGHKEVSARLPRLVYASISGYGDDGPQLPALDSVLQAHAGLASLSGDGREPLKVGYSTADLLSGQYAALGILAALSERRRSGRGQFVDISMRDAIAWLTQSAWPEGVSPLPPCARMEAEDGWIVAETTPERLAAAVAQLPRPASRTLAGALMASLRAAGISATPVLELDQVFAQRAHRLRGTFCTIETGEGEPIPVLAAPIGLTGTPCLRPRAIPKLGADNAALLEGRATATR